MPPSSTVNSTALTPRTSVGPELLGVTCLRSADESRAREFAARLQLPLLEGKPDPESLAAGHLVLEIAESVPRLRMTGRGVAGPVTVGFEGAALAARRRAGHNELLGRAVAWKPSRAPRILDATGGFGLDAFLLADLGCELQVCEREPVMALLLADAIARALESDDAWLRDVASRMRLHDGDARTLDAQRLENYDVIYLDPMFPMDRKAAPAKEMQVLHRLLSARQAAPGAGADDYQLEAASLLEWACAQPVVRVVLKRPRRAPVLAGPAPGHTLRGRSVRFDVYPLPSRREQGQPD